MPDSSQRADLDRNAYGERSQFRAKARYMVKRAGRLIRRFVFRPLAPDTVFLPYPPARGAELGDFAARTTWYLGRWSRIGASSYPVEVPTYLDRAIDVMAAERRVLKGADTHFLIWKVTPWSFLRGFLRPFKYTIVDPSLAKDADRDGYLEVASRLGARMPGGFVADPPATRDSGAVRGKSALVLGTGPSARELRGGFEDWDYRIVCNSAIKDQELMRRLRPTHICFGDPVFHAGPSAYAGVFREDLRRVVEEYDSVMVVPSYCAPTLAANMPWARGRLLALELVNQDSWGIPSASSLAVRNTGNVLTQQMVPMAVALSSRIDVGGADGRKPDERYFWTHSKQHQYSDDLMQSVFTAHPAFFRDTDYADYYNQHCDAVASQVEHAESLGCTIRAVTTSYIPALAARAAW